MRHLTAVDESNEDSVLDELDDDPKNTRFKREKLIKNLIVQIQEAGSHIVVVDAYNITETSKFLKKSVRPVIDMIEDLFDESFKAQQSIRALAMKTMHNMTRTKNTLLGPVTDINDRIKGLLSEYFLGEQLLKDEAQLDIIELDKNQLLKRLEQSVDNLDGDDPAIDELFDLIEVLDEGGEVQDVVPVGDKRQKPAMAKGTWTRDDWVWEVEYADKVKRKYLTLDRKKISREVRKIKNKVEAEEEVGGITVSRKITPIISKGKTHEV